MDWTDPMWVQAAATVALCIAAVVAGFITFRIYEIESRRDAAREEDRRAEQASQVAGWIEWLEDSPSFGVLAKDLNRAMPGYACVLLNSSPLPVYDVLLSYWLLGESDVRAGSNGVGVLAPGERTIGIPRRVRQQWSDAEGSATMAVEVRFTDSAGRRWWRDHNGVLAERGPREPSSINADGDTDENDGALAE